MLEVNAVSVRASDGPLGPFTSDGSAGPAAFLLAIDQGGMVLIHLLPLKADGTAYSQYIGLNWSPTAGGYRIIGPAGS
jgi:hypothetical protein